jgi:hypothetical protein
VNQTDFKRLVVKWKLYPRSANPSSLLIATRPSILSLGATWFRPGRVVQAAHKFDERRLQFFGRLALVFLNERGYCALRLQSLQGLLYRFVVDVGKVKRRFHLASLHVGNKSVNVLHARITNAMLPDVLNFIAGFSRQPRQ